MFNKNEKWSIKMKNGQQPVNKNEKWSTNWSIKQMDNTLVNKNEKRTINMANKIKNGQQK